MIVSCQLRRVGVVAPARSDLAVYYLPELRLDPLATQVLGDEAEGTANSPTDQAAGELGLHYMPIAWHCLYRHPSSFRPAYLDTAVPGVETRPKTGLRVAFSGTRCSVARETSSR